MAIEFLNDAILDTYLGELRRLGAPAAETLVPGLSDAEIDAVLEPVGVELPEEARVWWRWRNGTDPDAGDAETLFGDRHYLSLQDNLDYYEALNAIWEDEGYSKLLQPVDQKPYIIFDCRGPRDAPVPVLWSEDIEEPEPWTPSIGSLILRWIEVLRSGHITIGADGIWDYGPLNGRPIREIGF
jgi:hypothetical protein